MANTLNKVKNELNVQVDEELKDDTFDLLIEKLIKFINVDLVIRENTKFDEDMIYHNLPQFMQSIK